MKLAVRGVRGRLFLAVVLPVAIAVAALTAAFNVVLARTLDRSTDNVLRGRAAAELRSLKPSGGRLKLGEAPDQGAADSPVWIFSTGRVLEAPGRSRALEHAARSLAGDGTRFATLASTETRLYAVPVVANNRKLGTVVVGVSLDPAEQTKHTALVGSLILAILLLLTVGAGAAWLLRAALRPVARMTAEAAAWSERDLDQRFGLGEPYDELTGLAATLDELLERIATSLRRERRFSAELSHELRTPLSSIVAESELALRRLREPAAYQSALGTIKENASKLTRTIDALVAAAQQEASGRRGTSDAAAVAASVVGACERLASEQGVSVETAKPPSAIRLAIEADFAERILQPVVENACRYARDFVRVSVARDGRRVRYVVEDDGPGVRAEDRERIFEPGARGATVSDGGAGLGLALARRLARSAAGDVVADDGSGSGGRFVITLPAG